MFSHFNIYNGDKMTTTIGIKYKDGIILAADRQVSSENFVASKTGDKIYQVDKTIGVTISGLVADAYNLVERLKAEFKLYYYDKKRSIPIENAARLASNIFYGTFRGGRPLYAQVLIGGFTGNGHTPDIIPQPKLFVIDPSGGTIEDNFIATGSGSQLAWGLLENSYKENLTEDLEIAMRLKYLGYKVDMEPSSITHTVVPQNMISLWRQRIRWSRGFIYNHWKYRKMFFSRKHSLFGIFQMPVNVLVVILLIINITIVGYMLLSKTVEFAIRSVTIDGYLIDSIMRFPDLKAIILGQNARIMLPIIMCSILGIYLIILTHRIFKERLSSNIFPVVSYFIFLPYFTTLNWLSSIAQELMKTRKKW